MREVARPKSLYSDDVHRVVACETCGLVFVNPAPDPSAQLAEYVNASGAVEYFRGLDGTRHDMWLRHLSAIRRRKRPPATLLDVGAGLGDFVSVAVRAGYDALGLELNQPVVDAARELGRPVECKRLEEVSGTYEIVHSSHTIEHVPDPAAFLEAKRRALCPGGVVYVDFPYVEPHEYARILESGEYDQWDPTAHLTYFTVERMKRLLTDQGFTDIEVHYHQGAAHIDREIVVRALDVVAAKLLRRRRRCFRPWGITAVRTAD